MSSPQGRNAAPAAGVTVRSGSAVSPIDRTRPSKPLNTESRTIIAATGMATATALRTEIRWITERDADEKR